MWTRLKEGRSMSGPDYIQTVGELISILNSFDHNAPVLMRGDQSSAEKILGVFKGPRDLVIVAGRGD
jgi:hypothetical protein